MTIHDALKRDGDVDLDVAYETHDAVIDLARALRHRDAAEAVGKAMACHEVERLAQMFRAADLDDVAMTLVREHAAHDTDLTGEDIQEWHGAEARECGDCSDHPGWAHGDEARRTAVDYCGFCLGSGVYGG